MPRKTLIIVFAILFITGIAHDAAAQAWSGSGRIKGLVVDEDGEPVKGATVIYQKAADRGTAPPPFVTNKKGKYSFLGLRGGSWLVHAEAEGYYPSDEVLSEVYSTGVSEPLKLVLTKMPEELIRDKARMAANENLEKGDAYRKKGEFEKARKEYEKSLDTLKKEDQPIILSAIAGTYLSEGKTAEAKATLEKSLAIDPEHVSSLKAMCAIVAAEGNVADAEVMLTKIPETEVVDANTLLNIGMSYYNTGEPAKALPFLDRAVGHFSENPNARYFRGLVNLNLGDNAGALADFEKLIEVAPESQQAIEAKEQFLDYLKSQVAPE